MTDAAAVDLSAYCRTVEEHLTRVNAGHLVRIVGPAFELVRQWAMDAVPLSVVMRGIDAKAERHRRGSARRPLRIEHCDADVREVHDAWRRAIGVAPPVTAAPGEAAAGQAARKPSLTRQLDRVVERLGGLLGRRDLSDDLRDVAARLMGEVAALRDQARATRGQDRAGFGTALEPLDRALMAAARAGVAAEVRDALVHDATEELAPYRGRLAGEEWQRAVDATAGRLLRERLRLPVISVEGAA